MVRFNPNLYASGKVCLSLLGTWGGEKGESWNPHVSTLLQVIISIQSLILVENPYFNEPGYERNMYSEEKQLANKKYNETIQLYTIQVGMINMLKTPIPSYELFISEHFRIKKGEITDTITGWINNANMYKKEMKTSLTDLLKLI